MIFIPNFLKNAELRFQTGESGNIEVISAKAKVKEIETQKAQLEYDLAIYQKQLQFFVQTDENIVPDDKTSLQYTDSKRRRKFESRRFNDRLLPTADFGISKRSQYL